MAKHTKDINVGRLILMVVAALAVVGIIIITAVAIIGDRKSESKSAEAFLDMIHTYQDIDVAADAKPVTGAQRCLDVTGETIAYTVTAYGEGFADRVSVRCFFDLDKKTLICIEVTDHSETKGKGDKIATSMYTQHFEYVKMPVWFYDGSIPEEDLTKQNGTRIDAISGATVSCNAVVEAVNAAYTYYTGTLVK